MNISILRRLALAFLVVGGLGFAASSQAEDATLTIDCLPKLFGLTLDTHGPGNGLQNSIQCIYIGMDPGKKHGNTLEVLVYPTPDLPGGMDPNLSLVREAIAAQDALKDQLIGSDPNAVELIAEEACQKTGYFAVISRASLLDLPEVDFRYLASAYGSKDKAVLLASYGVEGMTFAIRSDRPVSTQSASTNAQSLCSLGAEVGDVLSRNASLSSTG